MWLARYLPVVPEKECRVEKRSAFHHAPKESHEMHVVECAAFSTLLAAARYYSTRSGSQLTASLSPSSLPPAGEGVREPGCCFLCLDLISGITDYRSCNNPISRNPALQKSPVFASRKSQKNSTKTWPSLWITRGCGGRIARPCGKPEDGQNPVQNGNNNLTLHTSQNIDSWKIFGRLAPQGWSRN